MLIVRYMNKKDWNHNLLKNMTDMLLTIVFMNILFFTIS
jgi:hypothetical protein